MIVLELSGYIAPRHPGSVITRYKDSTEYELVDFSDLATLLVCHFCVRRD